MIALILGTGIAFSATAAVAHHSISAEFDTDKRIEFTGKVIKIDWLNPHTYTHVEVEQEDGTTIVYRVEGGPPNALFRSGWRENSLPIGETVTVSGAMARNPGSTNIGSASIINSAGQRVWSGQAPN
jgi:hypothetical protein